MWHIPGTYSEWVISLLWETNHLLMRHQSHRLKPVYPNLVSTSFFWPAASLLSPGQSGTGQNWYPAGEATSQHGLRDLCVSTAWRVGKQTPQWSRSHTYVVDKHRWVCVGVPDSQQADRHKSPCRSVPLPPAGQLRVRDVTHSTMNLDWDAAPGPVEKYLITYKPENGEAREVRSCWLLSCPVLSCQVVLSNTILKKPLFSFRRTSSACALLESSELMNDTFICIILTDPSAYWRVADNEDCSCSGHWGMIPSLVKYRTWFAGVKGLLWCRRLDQFFIVALPLLGLFGLPPTIVQPAFCYFLTHKSRKGRL